MDDMYTKEDRILVLENIRSAHNVGAIFRTADAAGIREIILVGYTPSPYDRFGRPVIEIAKTALGAEAIVPYQIFPSSEEVVNYLKSTQVNIVVVEQTDKSESLFTYSPTSATTAFVFGHEIDGVSTIMREQADMHLEIPMYGQKESLNVSTCVRVVSYVTLLQATKYASPK